MSSLKVLLFGLGVAASLSGCSNSDSPGGESSEDGGSGGGKGGGAGGSSAASKCEDVDYASYASGQPTMSFKKDIMPIFGFGCVASGCHSKKEHKADLDLGVKCVPNTAEKTCDFPATSDAPDDISKPQPLDDATLQAVYDSLMKDSTTVQEPVTKRVIPGDPEHSFLIQKLSGNQNQPTYTKCESTDPSHAVDKTSKCGDSMPLGGNRLCDGSSRYKFDRLATWIQQGAENN